MKTVTVSASKQYDIKIGPGIITSLGSELKHLGKVQKVCIVSDSNVYPIYGKTVESSLQEAGFSLCSYVFPAGEESKNGLVFLDLLNFMAEHKLTRTDLIVALGGGVVGDLAGFAAAVYLRGIRFVQIPTTLLAAVDSSVGGKTAIDLPAGKNLAGAFWQPSLVLCDTDMLNTLPESVFLDGCAEVIKYGIIYDADFFRYLQTAGPSFDREAVIARCVELKRDVVMEDEFDTGARQKLNLGHTIGHGIEKHSHFTISHGQAVAIGMVIVSKAAACCGICSQETAGQIFDIINQFGLPCSTIFSAADLYLSALSDKKRTGDTVNLIVPKHIGECIIHPVHVNEIQKFIESGL